MTRLGLLGATGRMGRAIAAFAPELDATIVGGIDEGDAGSLAQDADVLVDFSVAAAVRAHLEAAVNANTPIVIGTTGLTADDHAAIDAAAARIAVLQTGNTSLGVTLLAQLVQEAAARLGPEWDVEIVELHHRHKVDSPSGTALLLGEAAAAGRGVALADALVAGRSGLTGARDEGAIGFASLRGGSVVGDHQVILAGPGERIELGHRADDRVIFARGAVKAAQWLATQRPGRYTMRDVLGL